MTEADVQSDATQPPSYRGDQERQLKELEPAQLEILQLQLAEHARLNESELNSELRDRFAAGDTSLPAGTLIHGLRTYSPEAVTSIATYGVMSGELFGKSEDLETHYCADFWKVEKDTDIAGYTDEITGKEPDSSLIHRSERNFIPNPKFKNERLAIIIDAAIPEMQQLLEADAYRPGTEELFEGITNRLPADKDSPKYKRLAAILGGVPKGAIAGILVSPKMAENTERMAHIRDAFGEDMPILGVDGHLIGMAKN